MATMSPTTTKSDVDTQRDVLRAILWEPRMGDSGVGVHVKLGVVPLVGPVDSWSKEQAACEAARRVPGVLDVANDIEVRLPRPWKQTDAEIAETVRGALAWNTHVPHEHVLSTVVDGWVTLEGHVDSGFQEAGPFRCTFTG